MTATLPAVHGEVNPVDFVALETLRLFAPTAYEASASAVTPSCCRPTPAGPRPAC